MWKTLPEVERMTPVARGLWAGLGDMLAADPDDPRAQRKALKANRAVTLDCFELIGVNFVGVRECPYLPVGKMFWDHDETTVLVEANTAQHLVDSSAGVHLLADLAEKQPPSGLIDVDLDFLLAGAADDVVAQAADGLDDDVEV